MITQESFNPKYWNCFKGLANLYGIDNLYKFATSQVIVIGLGGVGSWAVESLARTGIGSIVLIDGDDVSASNTNRQLVALSSTVGDEKTAVLEARCKDINPLLDVQSFSYFLDDENISELIKAHPFIPQALNTQNLASQENTQAVNSHTKTVYVIDCIDATDLKAQVINYCRRHKIKLVVCGGAGGKMDVSKILLSDLTQTTQDPLLKNVRNKLRRNYGYRERFGDKKFGVPCVSSTEQLTYPKHLAACDLKSLNCSTGYGSTQIVTATFAHYAVQKILDYICKTSA